MTQLRDARLAHALDHAPDVQALPEDAVRRAVRQAARRAVAPAAQPAWWKRWWAGDAGQRMPWNAALASVLLASLVTLLWVDRDIPEAQPQGGRIQVPAVPATAPAASPPAAQPAPASKPEPQPARRNEPAADQERLAMAQEKAAAAQAAETQRKQRAEATLAKSAPAQADMARREDAAQEHAVAAPPAAARPPAMAAPAPAAPAAPATAQRGSMVPAPAPGPRFAPDTATADLRIGIDGRVIGVSRVQAPRLAELVGAMAALAGETEPLQGPVLARIEMLQGGLVLGTLELAPPQIRWTPPGGSGLTARPEPAQLQALHDELGRLPGR